MMECLRYAVTKDPQAKEHAIKAYEAMEFLQTVTETDGFFARSVVPVAERSMEAHNRVYTPQQIAARRITDPRWKYVQERWRKSADGKWW